MSGDRGTPVVLDRDEALVLFEMLARSQDKERAIPIEHPAERAALWSLLAVLERELSEPFRDDYGEILGRSRKRLATRYGLEPSAGAS